MGFDIPMRTRGALDRNSLIQNYGVQGDTASAPQNSAALNNGANSGTQQQNANNNNRQNTPPQNNYNNQNQGYNNQPQNNYNNQNQGYNNQPQNNYNNQNQSYNNQPQNNYNNPNQCYNNQPQNNYNNQNQGYNNQPQNNYNNHNQGYNNQPQNNYNNPNQGGYNNYAPVNSGYNQNQGYVNQPVNNYAPVNSQFNDPFAGIGNTINGFVGGLDNSFNDVFTSAPAPNYGQPQNVVQSADTLGQTTSSGGVYSSRGQGMPNNQQMNNPPMNNAPVNRAQPNNFPNNRGGMTSAQNAVSGGVYQSNGMNNGSAQMQPSAPVKPRIKRQRLSRTGSLLAKGQKVPLKDKKGVRLERIKICFGWEALRDNVEPDASAFMLGANGKVISDDWFIFYGQPESPDRSVKYEVFDEDPRSPDDAALTIDLNKVSADVQKIVLAVTLYEAFDRRQNFSMVRDMYARITNCSNAAEVMRFEMKEGYATVTAMVLGELYRHNGEWKFNSVGSGVNKDLADFCGMYGVALE